METILQEAKAAAAEEGTVGLGAVAAPAVVPWDARQAGEMRREQLRTLTLLHEAFAQNLTNSLGAYLRTAFQSNLVSSAHSTYGEFAKSIPELPYIVSCRLAPLESSALLQVDLPVAFALLDLLLGGEGRGTPPQRQFTLIEEQVLESLMRILCRELQTTWRALSLEFQVEQRQSRENAERFLEPGEKILCLTFDLTVCETRGSLKIVVPALVSNNLLRKISAEWVRPKPRVAGDSGERLRERLLNCPFTVEVSLTVVPVPAREITQLAPGSLLVLRRPISELATVLVQGQEAFRAAVARRGAVRVGQVVSPLLQAVERRCGHE